MKLCIMARKICSLLYLLICFCCNAVVVAVTNDIDKRISEIPEKVATFLYEELSVRTLKDINNIDKAIVTCLCNCSVNILNSDYHTKCALLHNINGTNVHDNWISIFSGIGQSEINEYFKRGKDYCITKINLKKWFAEKYEATKKR